MNEREPPWSEIPTRAELRAEIESLRAEKEYLLALLRKAANEIDELGFPSKADEFLSAIITCAK